MKVVSALVKLTVFLAVLATPLLGVWVASSMAAWLDGPRWLVVAAGLLLFPGLPLVWEGLAAWRKRRKKQRASSSSFLSDLDRRRRQGLGLGVFDRLVLRTLALNVAFLGVLVLAVPRQAGLAVATRGDWMLDGVDEPWADRARFRLLHTADRLGFLVTEDNPWAELADEEEVVLPEEPEVTEVDVTLVLPEGAHARVDGLFPPEDLEGTVTRRVARGPGSLRVDFDDSQRLLCAFDATGGQTLSLDSGALVDGPARRECVQLRAADPPWRPDLYLMYQDEPVVLAAEVRAVHIREPYLRVLLTDEGNRQLCAATRAHPWHRVVVKVGDEVKGIAPEDTKEQCTGAVSVPLESQGDPTLIPEVASGQSPWPLPASPHPALAEIPADHEASIALLGKWMRKRAADPFERTKLVHDYIVDRLSYDDASADTEHRAPQDADTVFRTRTGVCAGYANLMVALGRAADLEVTYVTGLARTTKSPSGSPHAWNAVRIDGAWYLVDATWDDPTGGRRTYTTDYLFTPPEVFALSHRPEADPWQLVASPVSRGDFVRQPLLRPSFFSADLRLDDPDRSQITVDSDARLRIRNPGEVDLMVQYGPEGQKKRCKLSGRTDVQVTCALPQGTWDVELFHGAGAGWYTFDGAIQVQRR